MNKNLLYKRNFLILKLIIGVLLLLLGCNQISSDEPAHDDIGFTLTPGVTSDQQVSPPSATPMYLDITHWAHFNSPIEVLQSDVHHIGQALDGTLWFGGIKIYQYDMKKWTIYDQKNIPVFRGQVIKSLTVTSNGTLWLGTEMNEIVSYDGKNWASRIVGDGEYRENWITSILVRKNGELCAVSIEGMSCLNNDKWKHYPFIIPDTVNRIHVKDAVLTDKDEIWIPIDNGFLYYYDGIKWEGSKISSWICCIASRQDENLWLFSHEGFGKINMASKDGDYELVPDIISQYITTIEETTDGVVWIGTGGGYQILRYVNDEFVTMDEKTIDNFEDKNEYLKITNFPFYHVHCIFQANDGSIWFGTVGGIF